jgi:hypothetical protein
VLSPDGRYAFLGEGGAITFIDTVATTDGEGQPCAGMDCVMKRHRVGSTEAARVVRMATDPDWATHPILFLAAGRSGLWVMDGSADMSAGYVNLAVRVDDSIDLNPATQDSARWCGDVDTISIGGTWFVATTFQDKAGSKLRLYELSAVRGVLATGQGTGMEMGHEIAPFVNVNLPPFHPGDGTYTGGTGEYDDGLAISLSPGGDDGTRTWIYVALGMQGLVRVGFENATANATPSQTDKPWNLHVNGRSRPPKPYGAALRACGEGSLRSLAAMP